MSATRGGAAAGPRPIVFMTDYGTADEFVGICHGVIARIAPAARVIDLTHAIPRQDVLRGALTLGRAMPYLPADAVHCAVVDPGVGSARRSIAVAAGSGALLVGPDNGVLSLAWVALGGVAAAHEITSPLVLLEPVSRTFHGRDVFAPAAAWLASGMPLEEVGPAVDAGSLLAVELPTAMVTPGAIGARVVGVDGFGNVQLGATPADLEAAGVGSDGSLAVGGRRLPLVAAFADLPVQTVGALVDAQGMLALVVNQGSAAERLGLREGDTVVIE